MNLVDEVGIGMTGGTRGRLGFHTGGPKVGVDILGRQPAGAIRAHVG